MYHCGRRGKPGRLRLSPPTLAIVTEGVSTHFTEDGAAAVAAATEAARAHNAAEITTEHLLAGLLQHADAALTELVSPYGLTADTAARRILPARPDDPAVDAPVFSRRVKQLLSIAQSQALLADGRICCATIFLALLLRRDGVALAFFRDKAELDEVTHAAWTLAGLSPRPERPPRPQTTPAS